MNHEPESNSNALKYGQYQQQTSQQHLQQQSLHQPQVGHIPPQVTIQHQLQPMNQTSSMIGANQPTPQQVYNHPAIQVQNQAQKGQQKARQDESQQQQQPPAPPPHHLAHHPHFTGYDINCN